MSIFNRKKKSAREQRRLERGHRYAQAYPDDTVNNLALYGTVYPAHLAPVEEEKHEEVDDNTEFDGNEGGYDPAPDAQMIERYSYPVTEVYQPTYDSTPSYSSYESSSSSSDSGSSYGSDSGSSDSGSY